MDQVGIRLINSQDIDELKWSQMLSSSPSIFTQYQEIWFLNSICKSWQVFVKGDYEAAFVFSTQKKGGFSLIYQPFFSRCFSFLGKSDASFEAAVFNRLKKQSKWIRINLPEKYTAFKDHLKALSFQQLDLGNDYESIHANYSTNAKRLLKKNKHLKLVKTNDVAAFISLFKHQVGDNIGYNASNYQNLETLLNEGLKREKLIIYAIHDQADVLGYAAFYFHNNIINYLKGALNEKGKKFGAMYFAFDQLIHLYAGKKFIFDFGGSNVEGIAAFYKKFGASDAVYYEYEINNLPKFVKGVKKIKDKLL